MGVRVHSSAKSRLAYGRSQKPVIILYKVVNTDIILQKHMASLQTACINPWSRMDYFYDGWMSFFTIHSHYKA